MLELVKKLLGLKKEEQVKKLDLIDELIDRHNRNPGYVPRKEYLDKCLTKKCTCDTNNDENISVDKNDFEQIQNEVNNPTEPNSCLKTSVKTFRKTNDKN